MLSVGPWTRLPLTVRWLSDKKQTLERLPPLQMPITSGSINVSKQTNTLPSIRKKNTNQTQTTNETITISDPCSLCNNTIEVNRLLSECQMCLFAVFFAQSWTHVSCPKCTTPFHIICLSKTFLNPSEHYLIPIDGICPSCQEILLWGEIIQNKYSNRSLHSVKCSQQSEDDDNHLCK